MDDSKKALDIVANVFLSEYTRLYYVNVSTNEYQSYSAEENMFDLKIEPSGADFFEKVNHDVDMIVFEEDRSLVKEK